MDTTSKTKVPAASFLDPAVCTLLGYLPDHSYPIEELRSARLELCREFGLSESATDQELLFSAKRMDDFARGSTQSEIFESLKAPEQIDAGELHNLRASYQRLKTVSSQEPDNGPQEQCRMSAMPRRQELDTAEIHRRSQKMQTLKSLRANENSKGITKLLDKLINLFKKSD